MTDIANLYANMLGQTVDISHPNTASGYYLATPQAVDAMNEQGTNLCPSNMRPGRMVIKGLPPNPTNPEGGYINTCGGKISQEDMPDVHIIDHPYRIYIDLVLALLVLVMLAAITVRTLK
jgi:hypothetical protein